jgi:hypothetical protein
MWLQVISPMDPEGPGADGETEITDVYGLLRDNYEDPAHIDGYMTEAERAAEDEQCNTTFEESQVAKAEADECERMKHSRTVAARIELTFPAPTKQAPAALERKTREQKVRTKDASRSRPAATLTAEDLDDPRRGPPAAASARQHHRTDTTGPTSPRFRDLARETLEQCQATAAAITAAGRALTQRENQLTEAVALNFPPGFGGQVNQTQPPVPEPKPARDRQGSQRGTRGSGVNRRQWAQGYPPWTTSLPNTRPRAVQ